MFKINKQNTLMFMFDENKIIMILFSLNFESIIDEVTTLE